MTTAQILRVSCNVGVEKARTRSGDLGRLASPGRRNDAVRVNSRRRNVKSPSDPVALRNMDPELFPHDMLFDNNIPTWLEKTLLDPSLTTQVHPWINRFRDGFIATVTNLPLPDIPEYVAACKKRAALLVNFCQEVVALVENGYRPYIFNKDNVLCESDYDLPFSKKVIGVDSNDNICVVHVNMTNHPQIYRYLYRAMLLAVLHSNVTQIATTAVVVQSWADGIYEGITYTDSERIADEEEFLSSANKEPSYTRNCELGVLLQEVSKDMKSDNPPPYIQDISRLRKYHYGYIHNHPWTIDDAWYSLKSSGSRLKSHANIPNCGLVMSLIESDYSDPIDEVIKYKSLYPDQPIDGLVQYHSLTLAVPKTSSRGLRFIHPQDNPRQDRGNYFQRMEEHSLRDILKGDCTYMQWLGQDSCSSWTRKTDRNKGWTLICSDIHHATDETEHEFLLQVWDMLYPDGVGACFLRLHTGKGFMQVHEKTRNGLKTNIIEYTQKCGVRCGTNSNFAVTLDIPHHVIVRCTMKAMGWEDYDPLQFYRLVGDDVTFRVPTWCWKEFFQRYTRLMGQAGMHVHPLNEKGMLSHSEDVMVRAEFCKQTFVNGSILSRIPHKLFFKEATPENKFACLIWLAKYERLYIYPELMLPIFNEFPWSSEKKTMAVLVWNYFVDHKMFGLADNHLTNMRIGDASLDPDLVYRLARCTFLAIFEDSVFDAVIDSHSRLSDKEREDKLKKFFNLVDQPETIGEFEEFYRQHTPAGTMGKYHMTVYKNEQLAKAVYSLRNSKFLEFAIGLGVFNEEEREIIRRCVTIVTTFSDDFGAPEGAVDQLLRCEQIFKNIQPHAIAKTTKRFSRSFFHILDMMVGETFAWLLEGNSGPDSSPEREQGKIMVP